MCHERIRKLTTKTLGIVIFALVFFSVHLAGSSLRLHSVAAAGGKSSATALTIDNFSYAPLQLEIAPGTQATWINKDVVSVDHKFESRAFDTDESFFVYVPGSRNTCARYIAK
jgi:plastocyanin